MCVSAGLSRILYSDHIIEACMSPAPSYLNRGSQYTAIRVTAIYGPTWIYVKVLPFVCYPGSFKYTLITRASLRDGPTRISSEFRSRSDRRATFLPPARSVLLPDARVRKARGERNRAEKAKGLEGGGICRPGPTQPNPAALPGVCGGGYPSSQAVTAAYESGHRRDGVGTFRPLVNATVERRGPACSGVCVCECANIHTTDRL